MKYNKEAVAVVLEIAPALAAYLAALEADTRNASPNVRRGFLEVADAVRALACEVVRLRAEVQKLGGEP